MAYVPIDPLGLINSLPGNSALYESIVTNHDEVYAAHEPPILDEVVDGDIVDEAQTDAALYTLRVRRNYDLRTVRVRVYASSTGGTTTLTARLGGASGTAAVTVAGWYTINLTPLLGGSVELLLLATTPGGVTANIYRIQVRTVGTAPTARRPSGFAAAYSGMYAASEPVASEHVSRLMSGPIIVARDLPACVAMHLSRRALAVGAKSFAAWQGYDSTAWEVVGRSRLPRCDEVARDYILDVHTIASSSGAQARITVGTASLLIPDMGNGVGTTYWSRAIFQLGAGPHEIRAAVLAGTGRTARICTMQLWRMQYEDR